MPPVNSAEAKVAEALRAIGLAIACNVFIDNYEVDVVVLGKIVIEVDGYHHYARDTKQRDSVKERHLVEAGYQLMRIRNSDVHDPTKLRTFAEEVKQILSARPDADVVAYTPLALPELQHLKEQLLAKEQARRPAPEPQRRSPDPAPKKKQSDQALFLEWLAKESIQDKEDPAPRRPRS